MSSPRHAAINPLFDLPQPKPPTPGRRPPPPLRAPSSALAATWTSMRPPPPPPAPGCPPCPRRRRLRPSAQPRPFLPDPTPRWVRETHQTVFLRWCKPRVCEHLTESNQSSEQIQLKGTKTGTETRREAGRPRSDGVLRRRLSRHISLLSRFTSLIV